MAFENNACEGECPTAHPAGQSGWDAQHKECAAVSNRGYYCTLPRNHKGKHVACSVSEHDIDVWESY